MQWILKKNGVYAWISPNILNVLEMPAVFALRQFGFSKKTSFVGVASNGDDLRFLAGLVEKKKLKPIIDRQFALRDIAEAHRYSESGPLSIKLGGR